MIHNSRIKIPYTVEGTWPALLFLHGFGVSPKYYGETIHILWKKFTVIAPECFGLNNIEKPPVTVQDSASLVYEICNELWIQPTVIAWHSLGWGIALEVGKNYPKSDIILINPLLPVSYGILWFIIRGIYKHLRAMTGITGWLRGVYFGFWIFIPFIYNMFRKYKYSFELIHNIAHFSITAFEIPQKIFLFSGRNDEYFEVQRFSEILKTKSNITQKIYPRLSHDWPIFYPEIAASDIIEAIESSKD